MSTDESTEAELFTTGYEIFIGALSVLSLVKIVLQAGLRDQALQTVVYTVDIVLSIAFLLDFTVRLSAHRHAFTISSVTSGGPTCSPACRFPKRRC